MLKVVKAFGSTAGRTSGASSAADPAPGCGSSALADAPVGLRGLCDEQDDQEATAASQAPAKAKDMFAAPSTSASSKSLQRQNSIISLKSSEASSPVKKVEAESAKKARVTFSS